MSYRIRDLFGDDFNLTVWQISKIAKLTLCHYQAIYIASMGFFLCSIEIRQFKIPQMALFEQIFKYLTLWYIVEITPCQLL